jgi:hypothetical protein
MAMGPNPVIDDLDLGPPREILQAEALSLLVALGPVRLASKLYPFTQRSLKHILQSAAENSKPISSNVKLLGSGAIHAYFFTPIMVTPLPTLQSLKARRRNGMPSPSFYLPVLNSHAQILITLAVFLLQGMTAITSGLAVMPREPLVIEAGDFMSDDDVDVAGDNGLVIATGSDASSVFSFGSIAAGGGGGSLSLAAGGRTSSLFSCAGGGMAGGDCGSSSLAAGGRVSSFSLFAGGGHAAAGGGSSSLVAGTLSSFAMVDDGTSSSFALESRIFHQASRHRHCLRHHPPHRHRPPKRHQPPPHLCHRQQYQNCRLYHHRHHCYRCHRQHHPSMRWGRW